MASQSPEGRQCGAGSPTSRPEGVAGDTLVLFYLWFCVVLFMVYSIYIHRRWTDLQMRWLLIEDFLWLILLFIVQMVSH